MIRFWFLCRLVFVIPTLFFGLLCMPFAAGMNWCLVRETRARRRQGLNRLSNRPRRVG
jgi:hypothetical protein